MYRTEWDLRAASLAPSSAISFVSVLLDRVPVSSQLMKNNRLYSLSASTISSSSPLPSCGSLLAALQTGEGCEHTLANTPKTVIVKLQQMDPMWPRQINWEINKAYTEPVFYIPIVCSVMGKHWNAISNRPRCNPRTTGVHLINATDMSMEEEQSANGSGVLSQLTGD